MHKTGLALLLLSAIDILIAMETVSISINEGDIFELKCSTNLQYPVVWHFRQSDGTHEIFLGGEISMTFKDMFLLRGNQSLGEYNLLIPSADGRYAGNYTCIDDEGLGSALLSVQLKIMASTSTTYMLPISEHTSDAENNEAPKAAASIFQNNTHSNSITNPGVVSGIVVLVAIIITIIIIVAMRKWHPKCKGNRHEGCPIDAETQPPSRPDSFETSPSLQMAPDSSASEESDIIGDHTMAKKSQRPRFNSQLSTSSTTPLMAVEKNEHM